MKHYFFVIFLIALLVHLYVAHIGWNNTIADVHAFRQTQTAIASYYFVKDGLRLDYEIPVFGAPWSIPFEFPLYQGIVATLSKSFSWPLDQTGRLVSLFFFYAMVPVIFLILTELKIPRPAQYLSVSCILLSPLYLFWSRTFMIESTALFLSLSFLAGIIRVAKQSSLPLIVLTAGVGALAGVVKVTTFVVVLFPAFCVFLFFFFNNKKKQPTAKRLLVFSFLTMVTIIFPLFISFLWTGYADHVKLQNPLASYTTSRGLSFWNFGTISGRFDPVAWQWMVLWIEKGMGSVYLLCVIPIALFFSRQYRLVSLLSILTFFVGPVTFFNLYFVHEYYFFATGLFALVPLGIALYGLSRVRFFRFLTCALFIPATLLFLLLSYRKTYFISQSTNAYQSAELGRVINFFTTDADVILLNQYDYDPQIAYYARRKAIVDWWRMPLSDRRFQKSLSLTGKERITAMYVRNEDRDVIPERIAYFGFSPAPVYSNQSGSLYVKKMEGSLLTNKIKQMEKAILYDGIASLVPERVTSTNAVERRFVGDKNVLLVHAMGEVVFALPEAASTLTAEYGIMPQGLDQDNNHASDGVIFTIELIKNGATKTLFRRHLMPWKNREERAMQMVKLPIPNDCRDCQLSLKTHPGASPLWDWSYWRGIQIQ